MARKVLVTTAIPYVNASPHMGFALELVQADTYARFRRLLGDDVHFLTGTDENALKNVQAAEKEGVDVREFVDRNAKRFKDLKDALNLSYDNFIRTTEERHFRGAQKLWLAAKEGEIYKKKYRGLYCVGCEAFYTLEELNENGECLEHPGKKLEIVEEENYFFKLSHYQRWLEDLIVNDKLKIIPEARKNEALSLVKQGLEDFSISRSKERARGWGVPVPYDESQIQYVWYDALSNYITALDYANEGPPFKNYWLESAERVHIIGKGIVRFHAVYWPALLKSASLPLPTTIFAHGYLTSGGRKMSKSLGNVIDPFEQVKKYGTEAVRYYLLREIPSYADGDYTEGKFKKVYNADLANGLGNLVRRVKTLVDQKGLDPTKLKQPRENRILEEIGPLLMRFKFDEALKYIWGSIGGLDAYINRERPWGLDPSRANKRLAEIVVGSESLISILEIAEALEPFLPETAEKIKKQFAGPKGVSSPPLFPRLLS